MSRRVRVPPDYSGVTGMYYAVIGLIRPTASTIRSSRSPSRMMKNSAGSVPCPPCRARHGRSPRSDPPRTEEDSRRSQWLKRVLRSPGPIQRAIGPHEVRYVPPRHFSLAAYLCLSVHRQAALPGTGRVSARRGREGETTAFLSILRGVLLFASMCGPLNFYRATIVFPQPAGPRLASSPQVGPGCRSAACPDRWSE